MQKDSLLAGVVIGALAPLVAYLVMTFTTLQQSFFPDKPIAFYVLAVVINLIIVRFGYRAGKVSQSKGVVLITFLAMLFLIVATKWKI